MRETQAHKYLTCLCFSYFSRENCNHQSYGWINFNARRVQRWIRIDRWNISKLIVDWISESLSLSAFYSPMINICKITYKIKRAFEILVLLAVIMLLFPTILLCIWKRIPSLSAVYRTHITISCASAFNANMHIRRCIGRRAASAFRAGINLISPRF